MNPELGVVLDRVVMDLSYELSCYLLSLHGRILAFSFRIIVMIFDDCLDKTLTVSSGPWCGVWNQF